MTKYKQQLYIGDNIIDVDILLVILIPMLISYLYFKLKSTCLKIKYNKTYSKYDDDTKKIIDKINKNLNSNENKALALFGSWGSGKTYLLENVIKPNILPNFWVVFKTIAIVLVQISFVLSLTFIFIHNNDNFKLIAILLINDYWLIYLLISLAICIRIESVIRGQVIYVSLFGKESFKQALDEIAQKSQNNKDFANKIITGLINRITGEKDLFSNLSENDLKGKLVCIDDIERRPESMVLEDVLGLISHLKTINKCNVIAIIGLQNEKNLKHSDNKTIQQKIDYINNINWEKTINEYSELQGNHNSMLTMVEKTINNSEYKDYKIHKEAFQSAISNINQGSYYNLRKYKEIIERLIKEDDIDKIFRKELDNKYYLWFLTQCFEYYINNNTLRVKYDYLYERIIIKNINNNITYEELKEIYKTSYDLAKLLECDIQEFYNQCALNKDCMFWLIIANISYCDDIIQLIYDEAIKVIKKNEDKKIQEFLENTKKIKELFNKNKQKLHEAIKTFNNNIIQLKEKNYYPSIYTTIQKFKYIQKNDKHKLNNTELNNDILMKLALKLSKYQENIDNNSLLKTLLVQLDRL